MMLLATNAFAPEFHQQALHHAWSITTEGDAPHLVCVSTPCSRLGVFDKIPIFICPRISG